MRNRDIEKVPFRSKLAKYKNIENRNEAFKKLTNKQKRREIAFDALKLIHQGVLIASYGCYWGGTLGEIKNNSNDSKELQENLLKLPKACTVCQRGAMMVSQIRLGNCIEPFESNIASGNENIIRGFSMEDFFKMEQAYENGAHYQYMYSKNNRRLANICCNVIANGNFNTDDKTDYLKKWKLAIE